MSATRNAPSAALAPARGPNVPSNVHSAVRQYCATDGHFSDSPSDALSSSSMFFEPRSPHSRQPERRWTVTINDSFIHDDVLLNLDLIGPDVKPGSVVALDLVKADSEKPPPISSYGRQPVLDRKEGTSGPASERRYICVVKDMPREMKARFPMVEVYVAKHIADAFGMKKGTQVTISPVC
jgi:hypothetical protein